MPSNDSDAERQPYCSECLKPLASWAEPHSIRECMEYEAQVAFSRHEKGGDGD